MSLAEADDRPREGAIVGPAATGAEALDRLVFDIPGGPLDQVLGRFGREAGVQLAVDASLTAGRQSPGVSGLLTPADALARLLAGTGLEAVRDPGGEYRLRAGSSAPAGAMESTRPSDRGTTGTATTLPTVTVSSARPVDGTSEGSGRYAPTVTDSATRLMLKPRETPQTVTVVTSQMIEDKGLISVEQVLNQAPGVSLVGDASQNSQIFVRGFSMESGIFIDGLNTAPANPTYEGSLSQGLDPAIADRVEIIKGATGLVAGLGSPSAAVNFIRKRPTREFQAHAEIGGGNWKRYGLEADISGPLAEGGRVRGRFVVANRGGHSWPARYSDNRTVLYGIGEVDLTPTTVATLAVDYQRNAADGAFNWSSNPAFYTDGTPFRPGPSWSTGQRWTNWDTRQTSVTPMLEHRFANDWKLKAAARSARGRIDYVSFYPGALVDRATGDIVGGWDDDVANGNGRRSDTDSADIYATGQFGWLGRQHDLAIGINYGRNRFAMTGTTSGPTDPYGVGSGEIPAPVFDPTLTTDNVDTQSQAGVFATARFNPTDRLKLLVGGRVSNWKLDSVDRINASDQAVKHTGIFTPYFGALYDITPAVTVYTSYAGVFRPGLYFGADGQLLDPTRGRNIEVGTKLGLFEDRLDFALAVYQAREDGVPEFANAGRGPNGAWIYRSVDGVKTNGAEIEVAGEPWKDWQISGGYTWNRAKSATGEPKYTYVPRQQFKLAASHRWSDRLTVGGTVRWQSRAWNDTTLRLEGASVPVVQQQKAYTLVDLMTRWHFSRQLSLTLNLNNLFDQTYYRSIWGYSDYGSPRSLFATVRIDW